MKLRRIISTGLALLMAIPLFSVTVSADTSLYYDDDVFYDSVSGATVNESDTVPNSYNYIKAISVTPDGTSNTPVSVNHTSIANEGIALSGIRYIVYNYYYSGSRTDLRPTLTLNESEFNMGATITAEAMDVLSTGFKSTLTLRQIIFDVGDYMGAYYFPNGTVPEMTFNPYGDIPASELTSSDKVYLNQIQFRSTAPSGTTAKYPVIFTSGRADAVGTDPETKFVAVGGTVTLPENPYTLEGYKFNGWICSDGNVRYDVGDTVTTISKTLNTAGYRRDTGRTYFVADWVVDDISDIKKVKFYSYRTDGDRLDSFDSVLSPVRYNISASTAGDNNEAVIRSNNWQNMPLDLEHYKYCAVLLYWNTDSDSTDKVTPILTLVNDGTETAALTEPIDVLASTELLKNQWVAAGFDIDSRLNQYEEYTNFDVSTILKQLEIRPFGYKDKESFANDKLYVADVIFFAEKPSDIYFSNGFIQGSNGYFNPDENLTKGQAAVILARIMGYIDGSTSSTPTAYTDISDADYWYDEVCYLEAKGALNPAEDGNVFGGADECPRADFVSYLVNAATGITGATAFGEMPAASDSFSGTLTRAEAVVYANTILRGRNYTNSDIAAFEDTNYIDVEKTDWYAPDVVLGSDDVILYKTADGDTEICTFPSGRSVTQKMYNAGAEYLEDLDATVEGRITAIRNTNVIPTPKTGGTTYYVSSYSGDTINSGTANYAPRTINSLDEVSNLNLNPGDVVLFKRGDVFKGTLTVEDGVTYSAYGTGNKPMFVNTSVYYSSAQNEWISNAHATSRWTEVYTGEDGAKIWKYSDETLRDVGAINLFKNDTKFNSTTPEIVVAYKDTPSFRSSTGEYYEVINRGDAGKITKISDTAYDYTTALDHDLMFFHDLGVGTSKNYPVAEESTGALYLRCDEGNPAEVFSDITFNGQGHVIVAASGGINGVTIDNICVRYFGSHGISLTSPSNFNVTNCEFGWGGGSLHGMQDNATITDANGEVDTDIKNFLRFGNAVEFYGAPVNCKIDNCYVYEMYDAGITHQIADSESDALMENVYYTNNVLENSTYNIEYFMSSCSTKSGVTRMMKDIYMTGNIIRRAGYGWGVQRPNNEPANIKGWVHENFGTNQVIENNIIDRTVNLTNSGSSSSYVLEIYSKFAGCTPYLKDNTIVQAPGRHLMRHGATGTSLSLYNIDSEELLNTIAGDGNEVYFCDEDKNEYADNVFWK